MREGRSRDGAELGKAAELPPTIPQTGVHKDPQSGMKFSCPQPPCPDTSMGRVAPALPSVPIRGPPALAGSDEESDGKPQPCPNEHAALWSPACPWPSYHSTGLGLPPAQPCTFLSPQGTAGKELN